MKKKFALIMCSLATCICLVGCDGKNNDTIPSDDKKEPERNINLEITEYIKKTLGDTWTYSEEKYKIEDDHSVQLVFNNIDDWAYCAYNTNDAITTLNKTKNEILKEIPSMTFICKQGTNKTAKVVYENISSITKNNVESHAKYYDANDNLINENAEVGFKKSCSTYKYKDIFRNPEKYILKHAKITGEVIQVAEDTDSGVDYWILRVNMTKNSWGYSDTIMIMIQKDAVDGRIIEDDIFTFYGLLSEPITYETIFGAEQTVPAMLALYAELNN